MKVLMNKKVGGAWGFITESFINALVDKGHVVKRYDDNIDTWMAFAPDVYIGCSGHKERIPQITSTKIAIHVNPYGPIDIKGINEEQKTIDWVAQQEPDVVFGYGSEIDRFYWQYWTSRLGINWVPMPTAGDKTLFKDLGLPRDLDLVYLGGRWSYKAQTIDRFLIPAWNTIKCKKKLNGWGGWPANFDAQAIDNSEVNSFFNRGRVGPCMSEMHTQKYGIDIPERVWKLALCGVLAIHDPIPISRDGLSSLSDMMPSAIIASDPEEYKSLLEYYVQNEEKRKMMVEKQKQDVLNANTYHHRIAGLLKGLGFDEEARKMVE